MYEQFCWFWADPQQKLAVHCLNPLPNLIYLFLIPRVITHHHHHQPLNHEGRWGTTDDFATSSLHFSLFSTALWDLLNSRPVHSLMLSSHLFLCLPCLLPPFTDGFVQTRWTGNMTIPLPFGSLYDRQEVFMWSSCLGCWILAWTSSLVTWSLCERCSILW